MKRLFEVVPAGTHKSYHPPEYFELKAEAKKHRIGQGQEVILGPDHWRYGLKGNARTHSHNARSGGSGTGFRRIR